MNRSRRQVHHVSTTDEDKIDDDHVDFVTSFNDHEDEDDDYHSSAEDSD